MSQHRHQSCFRGISCHGDIHPLDSHVSEEGMLGNSARWPDKESADEAAHSETMAHVHIGPLVSGGVERGDALDVP